MPGSPVVFFILAAVAVGTAVGMLVSRNAMYSALFLVLNFATVAVLYLILGAPFIALSQITVYAGSIMVLFLFVIMLLGAERLTAGKELRWQPLVAIPLVLILVADFVYNLFRHFDPELLFTRYMLPFEVTAVILLSAVVGAVMLAKPDKPSGGKAARYAASVPAPKPVEAAPEVKPENPAAEELEKEKVIQ
jgi:NADH-quinone oxidoreductase subunit J